MKVRPEDDLSLELQDQPGQYNDTSKRYLKRCPLRMRKKREAGSVRAAVWELARYYPIAMCRDVDSEVSLKDIPEARVEGLG